MKLEPNNAKTYNIYGLVYTVLGENAKAEQNFRRALTLAPQDSEARQNWGWYLCTHERVKESIPEFEQAVANPLYKTPEIPLINAGRCSAMIGDARRGGRLLPASARGRPEQRAGGLRPRAARVPGGRGTTTRGAG